MEHELAKFMSDESIPSCSFTTGTVTVNVITISGQDLTINQVDYVKRLSVHEDGMVAYRLKQTDDSFTDIPGTYQFISFKLELP